MKLEHEAITEAIIGSAYEVHNSRIWFLEKVGQKTLVELLSRGHSAEIEPSIRVELKSAIVGEYESRRVGIVDGKLIVDLKSQSNSIHHSLQSSAIVTLLEAKLPFRRAGKKQRFFDTSKAFPSRSLGRR